LDTFQVKLTVRDSVLNEDTETKEYVYDQYPDCIGGGPSIPDISEGYGEKVGNVTVIGITISELEEECECERRIEVVRIIHVTLNEFSQEDMNFAMSLREKLERMENKNKEIEEKAQELVELVYNPDDDFKPKKK
jgi:hypothetical protein